MAKFLLAVDVGNSRTKLGLFPETSLCVATGSLPQCAAATAVRHGQPIAWPGLATELGVRSDDVVQGVVAGSNPSAVAGVLNTWPTIWPVPVLLEDVTRFPVAVDLDEPNKAGVDRILNAVACNQIRQPGHPAVIVDTGTATTVDRISTDGAFQGGAILPGFELCARSLNQYTALLPFITIEELTEESHNPLGRNTREALRSGLVWGQVGAIKELIDRLCAVDNMPSLVVLTGGGAPIARDHLPNARWEPELSLQGLALVARHAWGTFA